MAKITQQELASNFEPIHASKLPELFNYRSNEIQAQIIKKKIQPYTSNTKINRRIYCKAKKYAFATYN